jgi:hypothetical protein
MPSSHCVLPPLARLRRLVACAAVLVLGLSLCGGAAQANHQKKTSSTSSSSTKASSSSLAPCSKRYRLAWAMPLKSSDVGKSPSSVFSRPEFRSSIAVRDPQKRMAIGKAPGGAPAIQMNVRKGENKLTAMMWNEFGSVGVDVACLHVDLYLETGFDWGTSGVKLGFGQWGGTIFKQAGGTDADHQDGWSVRNVHTYKYGVRIYSYHLNRPGSFGVQSPSPAVIPKGRWVPIDLEVKMNTVGKTDGYSKLWVDGKLAGTLNNLVYRKSRTWAIRGIKFSDMWGGNTNDPRNFSPKAQKMWYANYRLYTP